MPSPLPDSIVSDRLTLRAPRPEDADIIFEAWSQDPEVTRYLVWRPLERVELTRGFIASCIENWNTGVAFSYIVTMKDTGEVVGMLAARPKAHLVNIGYVLRRTHWGRGLMSEAVTAFTRIALAHPTLFRVEATCSVEIWHRPAYWRRAALSAKAGSPVIWFTRTSPWNPAIAGSMPPPGNRSPGFEFVCENLIRCVQRHGLKI